MHWLFLYLKKSLEGDITSDNTDLLLHHGICYEQQTFVKAYGKRERETVTSQQFKTLVTAVHKTLSLVLQESNCFF